MSRADVFEVARTLVAHAVSAHPEEVALVAYYGSHAKGTATEVSDLDLFYIPTGTNPPSMSVAFVLDGLPYDFWPVSWEGATRIADARSPRPWAVSASLIADARLLYARSDEEERRFVSLQDRIAELTRAAAKPYMVERASDAYRDVLAGLGKVRLACEVGDRAGAMWAGRMVFEAAVNTLALVNQTYFSKGWGANLAEVLALPARPADLEATIRALLLPESLAGLESAAARLASGTGSLLVAGREEIAGDVEAAEVFQDAFSFVHEYALKVRSAASRRDEIAAGYAAAVLQEEVCRMLHELAHGTPPGDADLLGDYGGAYLDAGFPDLFEPAATGDLETLAARVDGLEAAMAGWLDDRHIDRNVLDGMPDLDPFLNRRDPVREDPA